MRMSPFLSTKHEWMIRYPDINDLDNETAYSDYQNRQYELCCKYYKYEEYVKNLEMFYKEQYTYK